MAVETYPTIFAPATAPGRAGVAVLRISGPQAIAALSRLGGERTFAPRVLAMVELRDPADHDLIDKGMAVVFPAPHSFTGEDVVELHVHGADAVLAKLADILARMPGLRWAEPGEFSRRAFDNGKMDLTAAEGLADLLAAESESQRKQALRQMDGALARRLDALRRQGIDALAFNEAVIDFPEDELPDDTRAKGIGMIRALRAELVNLVDSAKVGSRIRQGISVAVIGAPNVGKSSLVNRLAGWDVSIVSATAGTTRDRVSVDLSVGGQAFTILDTAGLRETTEEIEAEGIRRAERAVASADVRVAVFAADSWPAPNDPTWRWVDSETVVVVNKSDLDSPDRPKPDGAPDPVRVSAANGAGFDMLTGAMRSRLAAVAAGRSGEAAPLTRERHRSIAMAALTALDRALAAPDLELQAEDLRLAVRELGRMTGRVDVEDVLDRIFAEFCIGK